MQLLGVLQSVEGSEMACCNWISTGAVPFPARILLYGHNSSHAPAVSADQRARKLTEKAALNAFQTVWTPIHIGRNAERRRIMVVPFGRVIASPENGAAERDMGVDTEELPRRHVAVDQIQTVTGSTFGEMVLEAQGPVMVEFMSYGCAHCRVMEPVLQKVAEVLKIRVSIFRANIGVEQELAEKYAIQGTPTFVMFRNGVEVGRAEGPSPDFKTVLAVVTQAFES